MAENFTKSNNEERLQECNTVDSTPASGVSSPGLFPGGRRKIALTRPSDKKLILLRTPNKF
jgi:hypothetical protein